jgi:hypothetical protein
MATYRLVENNLGFIKLLLDLHDAVGLAWVLVLDDIFLECGQGARILAQRGVGEGSARVLGQELIHNLTQELVGHQSRVVAICNDHTSNTLGPAVSVECVGLLLNVLPLAGLRLLGDRSVEKHQEFIVAIGRGAVNDLKKFGRGRI